MSRFNALITGLGFIPRGFSFLIRNPRLWAWALIPTVINLLILVGMIVVFINYYGDIYGWLTAHLGRPEILNPQAWYMHIAAALLWVVNLIFQFLIIVISLIILLIISYVAGLIIASPFNDAVSERVEVLASGFEPPAFKFGKFIKDLARIVKIESIKALVMLAIPVVLFVFNFIPAVGGIVYVILTFVFGAWSLGFSYADLPMGRRVVPLSARWGFARGNKWLLIGFGAGFAVPFFSLICVAPMVVGGTLLYSSIHNGNNWSVNISQ